MPSRLVSLACAFVADCVRTHALMSRLIVAVDRQAEAGGAHRQREEGPPVHRLPVRRQSNRHV